MARRKARTSITIAPELLAAVDRKAAADGRTRSDLVCEAVASYFASAEEKLLAEGYREMAGESLELARESELAQHQAWPEW
ncbi:MAG: ribbon-helix-helix domain-containing protein [Actinomycetota bacterium]|jgi:metal-responsive CopG/Arc/MetJ family transcriptional regulator|nr:ribbon-helix-helix domain-containing protein [Actinomycetota bacterium]MDA8168046.1 ribbon-helix-helix domain-containing protein [Actinomycetota bacterium]